MHDKNRLKTHQNEKKYHNLHEVRKIHLFYRLYCIFWRLSVEKENDSGGKFSQEQPLEIQWEWCSFRTELFELVACGFLYIFGM